MADIEGIKKRSTIPITDLASVFQSCSDQNACCCSTLLWQSLLRSYRTEQIAWCCKSNMSNVDFNLHIGWITYRLDKQCIEHEDNKRETCFVFIVLVRSPDLFAGSTAGRRLILVWFNYTKTWRGQGVSLGRRPLLLSWRWDRFCF